MKKILVVLSVCLSLEAFSRPVEVILDGPKQLVQDHTVVISIGIKLKDGNILGRELFEAKDLRAGITARTLQIDQEVKSCEFSWMISNHPPLQKGETRAPRPELLFPMGFKGVVKNACAIGPDGKIHLSVAPFRFSEVETTLVESSLEARKAKRVIAIIRPGSAALETFGSWGVNADKKTSLPVKITKRILSKGNLNYTVETYWFLTVGGSLRDNKSVSGNLISVE